MCWYHQVQSCKQHISRTIWGACQADTHPFCVKEVPLDSKIMQENANLYKDIMLKQMWEHCIHLQFFISCRPTHKREVVPLSFLVREKDFLSPLLSDPPFPSSLNLSTNLCGIVHHALKQEKTWSHQLTFLLCSEMILRYKYVCVHSSYAPQVKEPDWLHCRESLLDSCCRD